MLFHEPGKIEINSFPLIYKQPIEPAAESVSQEPDGNDSEIPVIPEAFFQVQSADDDLAKSIREINRPTVQAESSECAAEVLDVPDSRIVEMTVEDVSQQIIDEITQMLGGNASALYLCTDGQSQLMLYNAEETCAVLDPSNEFSKQLLAGNAVCVSGDVLSSGILSDGIVPEDLNNSVSFLAVPLEMMGMLLGILFLGFEIEIGEEFEQVKDMLKPYMVKLQEALG